MQPLSASGLLDLWERAAHAHPVDRALELAHCAAPGASREELAGFGVGRRDALLHAVRSALFGGQLEACSQCPACGEALELTLPRPHAAADESASVEVRVDAFTARVRVPHSYDLAAAARCASPSMARRMLFECCVEEAREDGREIGAAKLPDAVLVAASEALCSRSPDVETLLRLTCPACGHGWESVLDVAAFLWREIDAAAQRLLLEVHELALAYGWSEAEVLALGPARREIYLRMARA